MKRFLLSSCLCVLAFPVFAQDNAITIIRDDGTKEVIPLGANSPVVKDPVVVPRAPRLEVETVAAPTPEADVEATKSVIERVRDPVKPKAAVVQRKAKPKAAVKKKVAAQYVPKPMRKPYRRPLGASSGEPISKDKALYIALAEAPPSRDVQVNPIEDGQGLMYSVVFKTEDGGYEVLIDGVSGLIMRSGAIEDGQAFVKPGHLPMR